MTATIQGNKLHLNGVVDGSFYGEEGFSAEDVLLALALVKDQDEIEVHLNSPGGGASAGAAIHALLAGRSGKTNVTIEGIAASAASLIAMAGTRITMSAGAVMMIHDPQNITIGDSAAHAKTIEELEAFGTAYARIYAAKSGKSPDECREIMKAETWFSPDDAVAAGFADRTTATKAKAVAAFDYRLFEHAPAPLKTLASKNQWQQAAAHFQPTKQKEPTMSEKTVSPSAHTAATARIKSIMQAPEAQHREELAQHLAFDTTMDADAAIAIMKVSPVKNEGDEVNEYDAYVMRRATDSSRLNGEGLVGPLSRQGQRQSSGLVDAMKRRHGVAS